MRHPALLVLATAAAACAAACSSGNAKTSQPSTALPTAPPTQAAAHAATPPPSAVTPNVQISAPTTPSPEVLAILEKVKLTITELPRGFSYGQFQAFQPNEQAVNGYDTDPITLLDRLNKTGRIGGYIQQINAGDGEAGIGVTEEVWKDAAGAKAYFDDFPRPAKSIKYQEITLPQQLGEQVFAYEYTLTGPAGNQTGYSIAWRNGRFILGVGEAFPTGKESLDKLMTLATLLDAKATAAQV
jgi:hypothetical protein